MSTGAGAHLVQGLQCCVSRLQPLSYLHLDLCKLNVLYLHSSTPHHITSHHITPHHSTSHHTTPHHTTPNHITPHHTTLHHTTPHYITPHHITPHHTTPTLSLSHPPLPTLSPSHPHPPAAPGYPAAHLSCLRETQNSVSSSAAAKPSFKIKVGSVAQSVLWVGLHQCIVITCGLTLSSLLGVTALPLVCPPTAL